MEDLKQLFLPLYPDQFLGVERAVKIVRRASPFVRGDDEETDAEAPAGALCGRETFRTER